MGIEEAIRELRDSYELKHRQWAYNCLDVIKEELEKKNKVIDEMAEYIIELIKYNNPEEERDKEEIKEYFYKKVWL